MVHVTGIVALCALVHAPALQERDSPLDLARKYAEAVESINAEHARKPRKNTEEDLAKKVPKAARRALETLLELEDSPDVRDALVASAEAALDLDRVEDFERVRARLAGVSPEDAEELGTVRSLPDFVLRADAGAGEERLDDLAALVQVASWGFRDVFGIESLSKVPGKKLRVRAVLAERPAVAAFDPAPAFHTEIVVSLAGLADPAKLPAGGLLRELCRALARSVVIWGDGTSELDHGAWAEYAAVAVLDGLGDVSLLVAGLGGDLELADRSDWPTLKALRAELGDVSPTTKSREGLLTVFLDLHRQLGPELLGAAILYTDKKELGERIDRVRYLSFEDLNQGIRGVTRNQSDRDYAEFLLRR